MKSLMLASLMVLVGSAGNAAGLGDFGAMVQQQSPGCAPAAPLISRTAYFADAARPCCAAGVQCSQLLATTKIARPRRPSHT